MTVYKHYVIKKGDTIQSIAFKLYQDMNKWHDLVKLNDLRYPFLVDSPDKVLKDPEHLKCWGDRLLLPNNTNDVVRANRAKLKDTNTSYYRNQHYDAVLGNDIKLNLHTDVTLDEQRGVLVSNGRDLDTVDGIYNLKQSIIMRILTRKGTLYRHPNYGSTLPDMLGKPISSALLHDITTEVERVVSTDTRVKSAKVTKSRLSYNSIFITVSITPIGYDSAFDLYIYRSENGDLSLR